MIHYESRLVPLLKRLRKRSASGLLRRGRISRAVGLTLEARGFQQPVGALCWVKLSASERVEAEIVGFDDDASYLMSISHTQGIAPGMLITPTGRIAEVRVGAQLLGRVLNGAGEAIDGGEKLEIIENYPLISSPVNPLKRANIDTVLDVGIRAINGLLTIGRGQRIGLFAGSGVGKSVLLGMMSRFTAADLVVVGLIGERGREVKEFIETNLGEMGLKRAVVVAAPADESPLMRLHGAMVATSIAEYYRDQGKHVLLLMDSLTRFAQAQREIALSIGEPPATKGYPPSVFAKLPQLIERAGNAMTGGGSITAFYTVLTEGDDQQDPIADAARAILDGHIVLNRSLAEAGQYPAIDLEASISRVMPNIVPESQMKAMLVLKKYLSIYEKNKDMILLGAYTKGTDKQLDKAILCRDQIRDYISQDMNQCVSQEESLSKLRELASILEK
ncbi:nucleotide binding protein FliI [Legionella quinlivanii]|uniref:Flagellum-specific ATP synthase n=1 Tax=Legionella quinlivanii TaxID=45073 RepID=A0A0W0XXI3_9GAMM|nr:flagellar protein export ATPase FliI [Legionella quinlivanii]KTD49152.1 nucleotide binding protein FliI [Legionella quinlivanii]MCW8450190.1 flagellar protein export ATPase FliI [Legionella quinlivanii]SEG42921.1 flagellum-specific ATP synthase [Legionella quinlivanii DSM 21216]STY11662.1 nucleotide binding protein FliI [Legionella quinlivanii]